MGFILIQRNSSNNIGEKCTELLIGSWDIGETESDWLIKQCKVCAVFYTLYTVHLNFP